MSPSHQRSSRRTAWRNIINAFTPCVLATSVLAACSTVTAVPDPASGPSGIVWVSDSYAGGQRLLDSTVVDSVTGRWTVTRCGPVPATAPICRTADQQITSGMVDTVYRRLLFQRTVQADFLALNAVYPLVGVTPPDLLVQQLRVTQNQRVKDVSWRTGSLTPVTVHAFVCLLQQSLGYLILCAN